MTVKRALYSRVQYVPDPDRAEAANAGVVVFVPETRQLGLRLSPTLARVRRFFRLKGAEFLRLKSAAKALDSRMKLAATEGEFSSEADFAHFVSARADALRLSPPLPMLVTDIEPALARLYDQIVGDTEPTEKREGSGRTPRVGDRARLSCIDQCRAKKYPSSIVPVKSKRPAAEQIGSQYFVGHIASYSMPRKCSPDIRRVKLPAMHAEVATSSLDL